MSAIDVWVTVVNGVTDTTAKDFQRAEKVFVQVPLTFRIKKFTLNRDQTRAILGTDGKLALAGGPKEFTISQPGPAAALRAR
jgi:hypothetical protein